MRLNAKPASNVGRRVYRSFALASIVVVVATIIGVLLAEFGVRIFAPQALISDIVMADPDVDYRLRPNARGVMRSPEYSAKVQINSLGFRGAEVTVKKKPNVARVLFLGDSFVFGHGLGDHETLPFVVGEELERNHPGKFEIINAGVYGYSTANELDFLVKYGLPLKPDVIAIVVMLHDMFDNPTWYKLGSDGHLIRRHPKSRYAASRRITRYIPGAAWLRENSHLFKFIGIRLLPIVKSGLVKNGRDNFTETEEKDAVSGELSEDFYTNTDGAFAVTVALLDRLAKVAKQNGIRTVTFTLGSRNGIDKDGVKPKQMLAHTKLIQAARDAGFDEAFPLSPLLAREDKDALFFPVDGHWTAHATKLVAPEVARVIVRANEQRTGPH